MHNTYTYKASKFLIDRSYGYHIPCNTRHAWILRPGEIKEKKGDGPAGHGLSMSLDLVTQVITTVLDTADLMA